jgi:hypothetical protein
MASRPSARPHARQAVPARGRTVTGRGQELLDELAAADAAIEACWADWDRMLYAPASRSAGIPEPARDAWYARLTQVQAARQAVADRTWAYFEGPEATALERAAWTLMSPRWQHARQRR